MKTNNQHIFKSQRSSSIWLRFIAIIFFIAMGYFIYQFVLEYRDNKLAFFPLIFALITFVIGLGLTITRKLHFNLNKRTLKKELIIGFLRFGKWKPIPNPDYISVFQVEEGSYDIKAWFNQNEYIVIGLAKKLKTALDQGKEIALGLGVELLDAGTDPANSKWVAL